MSIRFGAILAAILLPAALALADLTEDDKAGSVVRLKGSALAVQDAIPRVLKKGDPVYVGDVLSTGRDSRLRIKTLDGGIFTLGARTSFNIIHFSFPGADAKPGLAARLLEGAVNGVSGELAKFASLRLETQAATIGIRGTKFWVGKIDGILNIAHWSGGGLLVANRAGRVVVSGAGHGTTVKDRDSAPTPPKRWPEAKRKRAMDMVAFE